MVKQAIATVAMVVALAGPAAAQGSGEPPPSEPPERIQPAPVPPVSVLPETGFTGADLVLVGGGLLVVGGSVLVVARRR